MPLNRNDTDNVEFGWNGMLVGRVVHYLLIDSTNTVKEISSRKSSTLLVSEPSMQESKQMRPQSPLIAWIPAYVNGITEYDKCNNLLPHLPQWSQIVCECHLWRSHWIHSSPLGRSLAACPSTSRPFWIMWRLPRISSFLCLSRQACSNCWAIALHIWFVLDLFASLANIAQARL